jgi:hypothetical protein
MGVAEGSFSAFSFEVFFGAVQTGFQLLFHVFDGFPALGGASSL